jgi:Capsule polysaccharide biosynthesis protein
VQAATPVVLFFARGYQSEFFPSLESERYQSIFATLTKVERVRVEGLGGRVVGSFEEDYASLAATPVVEGYLTTSFMSDRFLGRYPYQKRLEILGKEVSFWARILDKYAPVAVVNELVAIEISEVLLLECHARGIRYLAGMNCLVEDYFYWLPNPLSLSGKYMRAIAPGTESTLLARKYIRELLARDYKPFYVKNLRSRRNIKPLLVACAKMILWSARRAVSFAFESFRYEMYDEEYSKRLVVYFKGLVRSYDSIGDLPVGKEVIYYPLHQEPEATLNYMSEFYSNQAATIENILKCLNVSQVLVVKEHPVDKGSLLRRKFWSLRRQYSGLYYFPAELHGREVLAGAQRIVTLTSTVGWEAAVLGKKVYVLGQIFYDHFEGVTAVHDFDDLKVKLRTDISGTTLDLERVETFVAQMVEQSVRGNPFPHANLYSEQNRRWVIDAIARALVPQEGS